MIHREQEIIQWAKDRRIVPDSTPAAQLAKTRSEWNEWLRDRSKDDIGDTIVTMVIGHWLSQERNLGDSVAEIEPVHFDCISRAEHIIEQLINGIDTDITCEGYGEQGNYAAVYLCLAELARLSGWTVKECIEIAWQDIKDRKGMMLHGTFVKQATLDRLAVYGVYPAHGRLESVVSSPEQRSQMAGVITGAEFSADSSFDKQSGTWLVFSTGLQKETV